MKTFNNKSNFAQNGYKKPENFLQAELDPMSSSYKMLMYREGFSHPNTYYSKKKDFEEPQDKEYLMLSMIERFVGRNNCFFRKFEQVQGKTYSPATLIEFWRVFQDDTEERLVLRMFHPTKNIIPFQLFDYLRDNEKVKMKLYHYYELMRVGKTEAIGASKPRKLEKEEETDFFWQKIAREDFAKHVAHLYSKYPSKGRIDIYQDAYLKMNYEEYFTPVTPQTVFNQTVTKVSTANASSISPLKKAMTIWAKCLEIICQNVPETAFRTWFLPIIPLRADDEKLVLKLPSRFVYEWIEDNYVSLMREAIDASIGKHGKLEYELS